MKALGKGPYEIHMLGQTLRPKHAERIGWGEYWGGSVRSTGRKHLAVASNRSLVRRGQLRVLRKPREETFQGGRTVSSVK